MAESDTIKDALLLRELLCYAPETGAFTWRVNRRGKAKAGDIAGTQNSSGYWLISVRDRLYYAHRLAWLYMKGEWPADQVDHINGNPADNRWVNLRTATNGQNQANSRCRNNNKSGVKGVHWDTRRGYWVAQIMINYKSINLGYFEDIADAASAYADAAAKYFGEYARAS